MKWLITKLMKRYHTHNLPFISAYMTYYWILAIFPMIIFILSLLSFTNLPTGIFMEYVEAAFPKTVVPIIKSTIEQFISYRSTTLLSIGGITTLWSTSKAVNAMVKGIHIAYGSSYIKPYIFSMLTASLYTIMLALLIVVLIVALIFGNQIGHYVLSFLHLDINFFMPTWDFIRFAATLVILIMVIYVLYRVIPRKYLKVKIVWPGVLFTSISWYLFSLVFAIYVDNYSKYNQLYGSIGSVFVLLIWLNVSCTLILLGAEINAILQTVRSKPLRRRLK